VNPLVLAAQLGCLFFDITLELDYKVKFSIIAYLLFFK